ncbi:MAG TPA: EAL domain-containing protein [Casimicrobiaceae bacterium]|nr:EAL domain-containing protein [Casimicrobiaceae bacterium]
MNDPAQLAQSDVKNAKASVSPRQRMRRLRKHLLPLQSESMSPIDLPAVRTGLLTKLNALTVGLIALTGIAISAYYFWQEWSNEGRELRQRARTIAAVLAAETEFSVYTADRTAVEHTLASLAEDRDVAYASVVDRKLEPIAERRFSRSVEGVGVPALPAGFAMPGAGQFAELEPVIGGRRHVEIIAPVGQPNAAAARAIADASAELAVRPPRDAGSPIGYLRLGISFERQREEMLAQALGTLTVVLLLTVVAVIASLLLTRRLVAPMRRLMRAARAVGSGRLDVYVPASTSDELGLLTHTFNHMTQRLSESQAEVANYQRTLEEKVAQRTKELEVATAHAYKLAQHDILTGLPNRSLLNARLRQIFNQAQRSGFQVACLFLDFDHFKRINDTLGHDAGDKLLQAIAQRLTSAVRESDTVARLGGDEFVVILPGLDPAHATFEIMTVLQRVRDSFQAPFRVADQTPTLTCSLGVSVYPLDAVDPVTLIKQADTAMYASKEAGRNAYRFYTADMNARVQQRLQLETDMRRGLMDDEFFLVYQPQIDLRSGRACGVEALLRWRDPQRGVVSPSDFIPIAEESGMIQALGARVLRDACRQVMQWHKQNMPLRLSVNLSVQQLQHDSWLAIVEEALSSTGLPAQYLDLEITESVIITHPERAVATLVRLKQMGVSITVDDFGTGYSSLSYLARLPIQGVKIDQRFVHGLEQNRNDEAITQAIIALSHSLGLRVIAEGVETAAQLEYLKRRGCEEAQGFFIARPLEAPELRSWWRMTEAAQFAAAPQPDLWTGS